MFNPEPYTSPYIFILEKKAKAMPGLSIWILYAPFHVTVFTFLFLAATFMEGILLFPGWMPILEYCIYFVCF